MSQYQIVVLQSGWSVIGGDANEDKEIVATDTWRWRWQGLFGLTMTNKENILWLQKL